MYRIRRMQCHRNSWTISRTLRLRIGQRWAEDGMRKCEVIFAQALRWLPYKISFVYPNSRGLSWGTLVQNLHNFHKFFVTQLWRSSLTFSSQQSSSDGQRRGFGYSASVLPGAAWIVGRRGDGSQRSEFSGQRSEGKEAWSEGHGAWGRRQILKVGNQRSEDRWQTTEDWNKRSHMKSEIKKNFFIPVKLGFWFHRTTVGLAD